MARVLFVEPFSGGSHKAFADGLKTHSGHDLELLTLPQGEWRRRMRRGAQELAAQAIDLPGQFDAIVATDMLDLAAFLALTRRRFGDTPSLLYLHENQFTYPRLRGTKLNSWFGQINYLSALAADRVAFNSEYHRQEFLGALRSLARQPNNWLVADSIEAIERKSSVLPVGVDLAWLDRHRIERDRFRPPLVLWNQRWEFDKAPETFARVVERLAADGLAFELAIAGEPGDNPSAAILGLPQRLPRRVRHFGFLESREAYARLLWESDVVVSTARHEFFGVGMVEALWCGCFPIAPARCNYPSLVPPELHEVCLWQTEEALVDLLQATIAERPSADAALRESVGLFRWELAAKEWDRALEALANLSVRREG